MQAQLLLANASNALLITTSEIHALAAQQLLIIPNVFAKDTTMTLQPQPAKSVLILPTKQSVQPSALITLSLDPLASTATLSPIKLIAQPVQISSIATPHAPTAQLLPLSWNARHAWEEDMDLLMLLNAKNVHRILLIKPVVLVLIFISPLQQIHAGPANHPSRQADVSALIISSMVLRVSNASR